ncbi:MAG: hypothetical protein EOO40_11055 [Deltaproteobacteria bacterium]|nr:MAG: hypothetical protein EOO40_11055 [Deltaproteobacteria bacterium]
MQAERVFALCAPHQAAVLAVAAAVCGSLWPQGLQGLLLGGSVALVNQLGSRRLAKPGGTPGRLAAALGLKSVAMVGLTTLLMAWLQPNLLAFAMGLATFFIGLTTALGHAACSQTAAVTKRAH